MKKCILLFLSAVACFAAKVVPYPVYIVEMENSTKAVVPWNVKDTEKFTTQVKNPIPGEYLLFGRQEKWTLNREVENLLESEGIKVGELRIKGLIGSATWIHTVSNVNDANKLLLMLKTDTNFANILPVDTSDKISKAIWNSDKSMESKLEINVRFKYSINKLQKLEILSVFERVHEGNYAENDTRFSAIYATFEQIVELAKNPFVDFIDRYEPPRTTFEMDLLNIFQLEQKFCQNIQANSNMLHYIINSVCKC